MEEDFKRLLEQSMKEKEKYELETREALLRATLIMNTYEAFTKGLIKHGLEYGKDGVTETYNVEKDNNVYVDDYFSPLIGYDITQFQKLNLQVNLGNDLNVYQCVKYFTADYKVFASLVFGIIEEQSKRKAYLDKFIETINWYKLDDRYTSWRKVFMRMDFNSQDIAYIRTCYHKNKLLIDLMDMKLSVKPLDVEDCIKKLFE